MLTSFFVFNFASPLPIKIRNNKLWPLHQSRCWPVGLALFLASTLFLLAPFSLSLTQILDNIALADGSIIDPYCETNFLISPDSNWMVYYARLETSQVYQLYSRPLDGHSGPIKLNGSMVNGDSVPVYCIFYARISPDSHWVVYLADQDIDGVNELYSRPIDGSGSPIKLSGPMVYGGDVSGWYGAFEISPDSRRVVYLADQDVDETYELYSRPIDGSGIPVKLNAPLVSVNDFRISPDSSQVIFTHFGKIYSRPIDGSGIPLQLNGPLVSNGFVWHYKISQDRKWLVYMVDQDTAGTDELYSGPLDGSGTVTKINGALVNGGDVVNFNISPDNKWIVYVAVADQDKDQVYEVYSRPIAGSGSPTKLNGLITGGKIDLNSNSFQISPDSQWVVYWVYWGDQDQVDVYGLYSRRIDGSGQPIKLDDIPLGSPNGATQEFQISPDSSQVVYVGYYYLQGNEHAELYVRPIDGSTGSINLNDPLIPNGNVGRLIISLDGSKVLYLADQDTDMMFEIYSVPIDGSQTSLKLNHWLASGDRVWEAQITPTASGWSI
jgi:hypothetical protein